MGANSRFMIVVRITSEGLQPPEIQSGFTEKLETIGSGPNVGISFKGGE